MKLKLTLLFIALLVSTTTVVAQLSQPVQAPEPLPAYDRSALTAEVSETYKALSVEDWDDLIHYRGVDHKPPEDLAYLADYYPDKISRLAQVLAETRDAAGIALLEAKIERLKEKFAAVIKEQELRAGDLVTRQIHHTVYYIDYVNGDDANDGLSTGAAWKTIDKFTTDTVRSPGDVAKLRGNTTWDYSAGGEAVDIVFDEDGTGAQPIEIRGCSSTDDPWGDGIDIKPIIDFGDDSYQLYLYYDWWWTLTNLAITQSADSYGGLQIKYGDYAHINGCDVHDSGQEGVYVAYTVEACFTDCAFYDNGTQSAYVDYWSVCRFHNCTFDGTTTYGINGHQGRLYLEDCSFGATTAHTVYSLYLSQSVSTWARNCNFADAMESSVGSGCQLFSEDHDQVFGAHKTVYYHGTITKDTGVVRPGGASSSAKLQPGATCSLNNPLTITDGVTGDFKIWSPAGSTTITLYIRSLGAWASYPTNSELLVEASYLSDAGSADRTEVRSTEVLSDDITWVGFQVTVTPAREGFVYLTVSLGKYQASKGIYVDIKPVVS